MKSNTKYVWIIALTLFLMGVVNLSAKPRLSHELIDTVKGLRQLYPTWGKEKLVVKSEEKSLYERFGGNKAITRVVDDFTARVLDDKRINLHFAHTDIVHFKGCLVNQLCEATGGPYKYTCRSMKDAHAFMGVTTADFNALVEDLVATLNKFKVEKAKQDELVAILAPMKKHIVEKP